jgi:hypothetical protein
MLQDAEIKQSNATMKGDLLEANYQDGAVFWLTDVVRNLEQLDCPKKGGRNK